MEHGFTVPCLHFVIFAVSTVADQPPESTLNDPALGDNLEARPFRLFDFQTDLVGLFAITHPIGNGLTGVTTVNPYSA